MAAPLLVRAWLGSPVVGEPAHLDGILTVAWALRHPRHSARPSRATAPEAIQSAHLPLWRVEVEGASIWLASAALGEGAPTATWQTRRRDPEDWDRLAASVTVGSGPHKDCLVRYEARAVEVLSWRAIGSRREVERSLRLLWGSEGTPSGFVGSARRAGAGAIRRWSVEVAAHGLLDCLLDEGRAIRHLPAGWVDSADRWYEGATAPPYWLPGAQERVPRLGSRVTLRPEIAEALSCSWTPRA